MNGISFTPPHRPPLGEAFKRARQALAGVESPTRPEILAVYRATRAAGCIVLRCRFEDVAPLKVKACPDE